MSMSGPILDQLRTTLGAAYTIERELGGGGMSRVFVAEEVALGRRVVLKDLSPDLLEGISAERFTLEVRLAARLQQANIVPLHSAETAGGLPYYTMPFVDGLSLRALLTTRGEGTRRGAFSRSNGAIASRVVRRGDRDARRVAAPVDAGRTLRQAAKASARRGVPREGGGVVSCGRLRR
jgi:serine/threonine protein kinase